jgi:hypothetical protein
LFFGHDLKAFILTHLSRNPNRIPSLVYAQN